MRFGSCFGSFALFSAVVSKALFKDDLFQAADVSHSCGISFAFIAGHDSIHYSLVFRRILLSPLRVVVIQISESQQQLLQLLDHSEDAVKLRVEFYHCRQLALLNSLFVFVGNGIEFFLLRLLHPLHRVLSSQSLEAFSDFEDLYQVAV